MWEKSLTSCVYVLQRYPAEVADLISEGEIGSGTCGQVFKVRFKKTGNVIAVKVSSAPGFSAQSVVPDNSFYFLVVWIGPGF